MVVLSLVVFCTFSALTTARLLSVSDGQLPAADSRLHASCRVQTFLAVQITVLVKVFTSRTVHHTANLFLTTFQLSSEHQIFFTFLCKVGNISILFQPISNSLI